jgi:phosphate transport system substrate-binding protein
MCLGLMCAGLLVACGSEPQPPLEDADIRISGSSTVYPISAEATRRFQRRNRGASVAVEFTGTTAGMRKFCTGEVHMVGASRPINTEESGLCGRNEIHFIEIPIAQDALSVVVHVDNDWAESITVAELGRIWEPAAQGRVMRWSDVREGWPDQPPWRHASPRPARRASSSSCPGVR